MVGFREIDLILRSGGEPRGGDLNKIEQAERGMSLVTFCKLAIVFRGYDESWEFPDAIIDEVSTWA